MKLFIGLLSYPTKTCCSLLTEPSDSKLESNFISLICMYASMLAPTILLALLIPCFTGVISTPSEFVYATENESVYFVNDQKNVIVPRLIYIKKIEVGIWELKYML